MGYAVEVYFDRESEAWVRDVWRRLEPITDFLRTVESRPHVSLATFSTLEPAQLRADLQALAAGTASFTLQMSSLGVFPGGVLFLAPVVADALRQLHRRMHQRMAALGLASDAYYRPPRWVPHCTLAMACTAVQLAAALPICLEADLFQPVECVEIGLTSYRPAREIYRFALTG